MDTFEINPYTFEISFLFVYGTSVFIIEIELCAKFGLMVWRFLDDR